MKGLIKSSAVVAVVLLAGACSSMSVVPVAYTVKYGFMPALRRGDRTALIARSAGELKEVLRRLEDRDLRRAGSVAASAERREGGARYQSFTRNGRRAVIVARGRTSVVEFHLLREDGGWKVTDMVVIRRGVRTSLVDSLRFVLTLREMIRSFRNGIMPPSLSPGLRKALGPYLPYLKGWLGRARSDSGATGAAISHRVEGRRGRLFMKWHSLTIDLDFRLHGRRWILRGGALSQGSVTVPLVSVLEAGASWLSAWHALERGERRSLSALLPGGTAWVVRHLPIRLVRFWEKGKGTGGAPAGWSVKLLGFSRGILSFDVGTGALGVRVWMSLPSGRLTDFRVRWGQLTLSASDVRSLAPCSEAYGWYSSPVADPQARAEAWDALVRCLCPSRRRGIALFHGISFPLERFHAHDGGPQRVSERSPLELRAMDGAISLAYGPFAMEISREDGTLCVKDFSYNGTSIPVLMRKASPLLVLWEGIVARDERVASSAFCDGIAPEVRAGLGRLFERTARFSTVLRKWAPLVVARLKRRLAGRGSGGSGQGLGIELKTEHGRTVICGGSLRVGRSSVDVALLARLLPWAMAYGAGFEQGRVRSRLIRPFTSRRLWKVLRLASRGLPGLPKVPWYTLEPGAGSMLAGTRPAPAVDSSSLVVRHVYDLGRGWATVSVRSPHLPFADGVLLSFVRTRARVWILKDVAILRGRRTIWLSSLGGFTIRLPF